jgi:hypothetical protein
MLGYNNIGDSSSNRVDVLTTHVASRSVASWLRAVLQQSTSLIEARNTDTKLTLLYRVHMTNNTQVVTLLSSIREVPGSNFAWGSHYPDGGYSWISSVPPVKCKIVSKIRLRSFPSTSFPVFYLLSSSHSTLRNLNYRRRF